MIFRNQKQTTTTAHRQTLAPRPWWRLLVLALVLVGLVGASACRPNNGLKKKRRPGAGGVPCPIKDC